MIVSYDEHDVNNTFKFGVIYQKARQVSTIVPIGHQSLFFMTLLLPHLKCRSPEIDSFSFLL